MGSLILILVIMVIVAIILYLIKSTRQYSYFFIGLIADVALIKVIHSWAASLVFGILNLTYNDTLDN